MSSIGQGKPHPLHINPKDNLWYFWDETWSYRIGPFLTEEEAIIALHKYVETL